MPRCPKIRIDGAVAIVKVTGEPKNQEPEAVRIAFPGGEVELVRATDGPGADYWVHVRVNRPEDDNVKALGEPVAHVTAARLDIRGRHASEVDVGEFADPGLYHLAVRVARGDRPPVSPPPLRAACPACGSDNIGTLELLEGRAGVHVDEATKTATYSGYTDVFWDGQTTKEDRNGHTVWICGSCAHEWPGPAVDGTVE